MLVNYFKAHALRIYGNVLKGSASVLDTKPERVRAWIEKKGNPGIRSRDLVASRIVDSSKEAMEVLDKLVKRGRGEWVEAEGLKKPIFRLNSALSSQQMKTSSKVDVRVDT